MAETFNPLKLGAAYCPDKNATFVIDRNFDAIKRILDSIASGEGIPGSRIADDAIDGTKIADDAITTTEILDDSISTPKLQANCVTSAKIIADAVTAAKINVVGLDGTSGKLVLSQIESGDLDNIDDGSTYARILATDILAGHILLSECSGDLDDITDGSSYGKVALTSITAGKIIVAGLADAVVARIFTNPTIKTYIEAWRHTTDVIWADGNNMVWLDENNIVWLASPSTDLTLIDGGDIYTGTITANQMAANTITATQIAARTITAVQISALTITAAEIAASTITAGKLTVTDLVDIAPLASEINVEDSGDVRYVSGGVLQLVPREVHDEILTSNATQVDVTVAGDTDHKYFIEIYLICNGDGIDFTMRLNDDDGNNYGRVYLKGDGTNATSGKTDPTSSWYLGGGDDGEVFLSMASLYARTSGAERLLVHQNITNSTGTTARYCYLIYQIWSNTADEIIKLSFISDVADGIGIGSHFSVYKKPSY